MQQNSSLPSDVTCKTWLITGASRGIGAAIARAALQAGHQVVATGREAAAVRAAFPEAGDRLLALAMDVTRPEQVTAAVDAVVARFGGIDVLVNNAGYGQLGQFEEVDADAIAAQFATNVFGLMHVTRAVLPTMRAQRAGRIFNLSSIGGLAGFAGSSVYCASKFAVEGFSASLAAEVAPFGILVTTVAPGFFRTDFLDSSSVRYGEHALSDYEGVTSTMREQFAAYNHHQPGDPVKLANAVLEIAGHAQPPLHFVAGTDALGILAAGAEQLRVDIETWRQLSEATAHS